MQSDFMKLYFNLELRILYICIWKKFKIKVDTGRFLPYKEIGNKKKQATW